MLSKANITLCEGDDDGVLVVVKLLCMFTCQASHFIGEARALARQVQRGAMRQHIAGSQRAGDTISPTCHARFERALLF